MPLFYASTSRGLAEALAGELRDLDLKVTKVDKQGVAFEGPWVDCVRANLHSRIAVRVALPVLDFPAYNPEDIYNNVKKHDFTKYLQPDMTFSVKAKLNECAIKDQRLLAMKVKDVIADQFNAKFGERPDVDKKVPNVRVFIFGSRNEFRLSVDTSGHSLSQRGYREESVEAPMREHVAAGLLRLSQWDMRTPLVDPMCGSGTLLIEAALQLKRIAPGTFQKKFAFQNFSHIPPELFDQELEKAMNDERDVTLEEFGLTAGGAVAPGLKPSAGLPQPAGSKSVGTKGSDPNTLGANTSLSKTSGVASSKSAGAGSSTTAGQRGALAKSSHVKSGALLRSAMGGAEPAKKVSESLPVVPLYGFDKNGQNIEAAKRNAERAGVEDLICFRKADATQLAPPVARGMIVTNPPHGVRLGDEFFLEELYKNWSFNLKNNYKGWSAWVLSGDPKWTAFLRMKSERSYAIDNGGVDCRWIHYKVL